MRISLKPFTLDIWTLFLHDRGCVAPVDEHDLAEEIQAYIASESTILPKYDLIEVLSPSYCGLSRWLLRTKLWGEDEVTYPSGRFYDVAKLRESLPVEIAQLLDRVNKRPFTLERQEEDK